MPPVVTTVTTRAHSADQLTDADYRDIYDELRSKCGLRQFAEQLGSRYSIATWSKYERGELTLPRPAKQELRAAVGLAPLPPTVEEAAARIDPDATVWQVGETVPNRVVMVGADVTKPFTVRLNSHVEIIDGDDNAPTPQPAVTAVTTPTRTRRPTKAIRVSPTAFQRLSAARQQSGLTWDDFLSHLLGEEAR